MAARELSDEQIMKAKERVAAIREAATKQFQEMDDMTEALSKQLDGLRKMQSDMDAAIKQCEKNGKQLDI
jgi:hypothetical protein